MGGEGREVGKLCGAHPTTGSELLKNTALNWLKRNHNRLQRYKTRPGYNSNSTLATHWISLMVNLHKRPILIVFLCEKWANCLVSVLIGNR
jgi:hypothetical protein